MSDQLRVLGREWPDIRTELIAAAGRSGVRGRGAVRVADLVTANAMAEARELLVPVDLGDAEARLDRLEFLSQHDLPSLEGSRADWRRCQELADQLAGSGAWTFSDWSSSSQSLDPGRKGRGAFSTHPELADVMARLATCGTDDLPLVLDPSVGHGALLLAALAVLRDGGASAAAAVGVLRGVELDPNARELCCLKLWLAAGDSRVSLAQLAGQIVLGNALTGSWSATVEALQTLFAVEPGPKSPLHWDRAFADAFANGGFDIVLSNPPWDSLRQQEVAGLDSDDERALTHARLSAQSPGRPDLPPLYSHQGRGDRNLYKGFVELFPHLLRDGGRLVALLPGAFASDLGMHPARLLFLDHMAVDQWTGFENLRGYFPIDGRYKFGILVARRSPGGGRQIRVRFMARDAADASDTRGHVALSRRQLATLGGPSLMFPEVTDRQELDVLATAAEAGAPFFDDAGSFGPIAYKRELDLTLDRKAGRFVHVEDAQVAGFAKDQQAIWKSNDQMLVPLIEGRMVGLFDFFEKSWEAGSGRSARWSLNRERVLGECQPQFLAPPRPAGSDRIAICDVTSATNTRTMLATYVPKTWSCGNTAPVIELADDRAAFALLAVLNSMTFDWILRRIAAGLHLNRFYLEAAPLPRVSDADLEELAAYGLKRSNNPRFRGLSNWDRGALPAPRTSVPDAAEVEAIVARGYGLSASHMERVMSQDRGDRKGLWRFFDATPGAAEMGRRSVRLLKAA